MKFNIVQSTRKASITYLIHDPVRTLMHSIESLGHASPFAGLDGSEAAAPRSAALAQAVASAVHWLSPTLAAATTPLLAKAKAHEADDEEIGISNGQDINVWFMRSEHAQDISSMMDGEDIRENEVRSTQSKEQ